MSYQPPFNLTHPMLSLVADIAELIGIWNTAQGGELATETPVKTLAKTPVQILELLSAQPELTLAEVAAHIGKSVSAIERAAAKLQREGKLKFIGPRKGGHWQVL